MADIGVFVGLQFFAANGNGGGGGSCIVPGVGPLFLVLVFFIGCVGGYIIVAVGLLDD